jgi:hypothetical protein
MKSMIAPGLAILSLAAFSIGAQAAPQCGPHARMTEVLAAKFKESRTAIGLVAGYQSVLEVFVSKKGTWTLVMTNARGISCVIGAGDSWENAPREVAGLVS